MATKISNLEANPLGHITGSLAIAQQNYESILNALVEWEHSKLDKVTVRLLTNTPPYMVDYVISTKHAADAAGGTNAAHPFLVGGGFAINEMVHAATSYDPANPDTLVVRVSTNYDFMKGARLYLVPAIYDECSRWNDETTSFEYFIATEFSKAYPANTFFANCVGDEDVPKSFALYRTTAEVAAGDDIAANSYPLVVDFEPNRQFRTEQLVRYRGKVYILSKDRNLGYYPDNPKSGYSLFCDCYTAETTYTYGTMVEHGGMFYVYKFEADTAVPPSDYVVEVEAETGELVENTTYWSRFYPLDAHFYVGNGGTLRVKPETDIVGIVVKNSRTTPFDEYPSIRIQSSIRIPAGRTAQPKGVEIIPSANYMYYPNSKSAKWSMGRQYGPTDTSIGVYGLQDYSAVMVFNHASKDVSRLNIINYDGPDLDQGLAIFLPVNIVGKNDEVVSPKDGCMFEFMFRIWPDPSLNGGKVNDLIVNKAHIYVYNVTDFADLDIASRKLSKNNAWPIAKFSMARMINYYLKDENVAIPDRPTVYKARFIYSATNNAWETFDYYQLPDHIFMAPNGFTDAAETAGFPMFQDPFSRVDMSPIRVGEEYFGRMKNTIDD